ncbi:MAG: adenine-specific methyltransferase EcoRI family protein [Acidaminococcaceae bacterium]|nr:adenine-specific methyltransferase EcoRI family protein [Acidaminococcaceae bacterium]
MSKNDTLHKSRVQKNDEFYTQLTDIEKELKNYKEHFRGKVVFCNCDDPYESNFFKYFAINFNRLGLKKLITTGYATSFVTGNELRLFDDEIGISKNQPYAVYINEVADLNGDGRIDLTDVELLLKMKKNTRRKLHGDDKYPAGDFRSEESIALLKQADIVVTNPPFSIFTEYIQQLFEYKKKFLVVGNQNNFLYKEILPMFLNNNIWLGNNCGHWWFKVPPYYEAKLTDYKVDKFGQKWRRMGNICWFTNLDYKERYVDLDLYKEYNSEEYPKYDNYDAINVDKVSEIPYDYDGVMGVPITFLSKRNPLQFDIVGIAKFNGAPKINGKSLYTRILIQKRKSALS